MEMMMHDDRTVRFLDEVDGAFTQIKLISENKKRQQKFSDVFSLGLFSR